MNSVVTQNHSFLYRLLYCALHNDELQVPIDSTQNNTVYGLLVSFHCLLSSHFLTTE
jgi:hypothetical protein